MGLSEAEYRRLLEEAFPADIMKGLMLGVAAGYKSAADHCKRHFDKEDRHDALGYVRRSKIQQSLRGVGERFALDTSDEPNKAGSTYFLSIFSGEFRLICCLVPAPNTMPRPAHIRKLWCRYNFAPQELLSFMPQQKKPEGALHLAVLIHSPLGRQREQPSFSDIVIPDQKFATYINRVRLFDRFSTVVEENPQLFKPRRNRGEAAAGA